MNLLTKPLMALRLYLLDKDTLKLFYLVVQEFLDPVFAETEIVSVVSIPINHVFEF